MASVPWVTGGNLKTNPPNDFLGTADNQPLAIKTNSTEQVYIDTSGRVGIGTNAPSSQLHVKVAASPNPISALTIDVQSFQTEPNAQASHFLLVHDIDAAPPNGLTHFAIRGDGLVGIGTAQPGGRLEVVDAGCSLRFSNEAGPAVLRVENSAPAGLAVLDLGNGARHWQLRVDGADGNKFKIFDATGVGTPLTVDTAGHVGIGTSNPFFGLDVSGGVGVTGTYASRDLQVTGSVGICTDLQNSVLEVSQSAPGVLGPVLALINTGGGANAAAAIDFYTFDPGEGAGPDHVTSPTSEIKAVDDGNFGNHIVFLSNKPGAANTPFVERMRITSTGNVTVPGDILLTGADCAEQFDVSGSDKPEPGTVVVIDEASTLRESRDAYDKKVAGVVSGAGAYKHAILLGKRPESEHSVPVALVGKVFCKVDAQYSPVEVGDLLTTSQTPGHAMKAIEPAQAFGAVIGKALSRLEKGQGLIPILIALQ
jgi:hypothetical protein